MFCEQRYLSLKQLVQMYIKKNTTKKYGAHTHAHHLSQLFSQYSRQLLSILAQKEQNKQTSNSESRTLLFKVCFVLHRFNHISHSCATKQKKYKAHMHAHHLSQLSSPIFTSVVVYSRTTKCLSSHNYHYWLKYFVFNIAPDFV